MSYKKIRKDAALPGARHARLLAALLGPVAVAGLAGLPASPATAQQVRTFSIPAGPLDDALSRFGAASGLQVLYGSSVTAGLRSGGAKGPLRPEAALERILQGTGLTYRFSDERSVTIARPGAAGGQKAAEGTTLLQTITVEGSGGARGPISGYVARESIAGTKTATPIMQNARSVEVIGQKELEQRGAGSMIEAVRYSAGVTTGAFGYDPRFDQIYVRGFGLTTFGDFKDGLRQMSSSYGTFRTDPYALERIDIVKGPASALYGQSTPGGLIDRVSKRPSQTPVREVMTRIDSTGRYQAGFDYGDVAKDRNEWRYRVVGLGRFGEGSYEVEDKRLMLAPSLTYAPDADTSLTILALAQHDKTDSNVAALNRNGRVYDIRASDPDYDTQKVRQYQLGYEFEHRFVDTWTFRNNSRVGYMKTESKYLTGSATGGGWKTDGSGRPYYARGTYGLSDRMWSAQTDASLLGQFDTGPLSHKLLAGLDHQASFSHYLYGSGAASSQYDLYLDNPVYGRSGAAPAYTAGRDTDIRQTGLYLQDQVELYDRWHANAGIRRDWVSRRQENNFTGATVADQDDTATTYNAGLLYESAIGLSPYFSYATSFQPTTYVDVTGAPLSPSTGEQFEIGVKYQPEGFNGFFSLAAYRLKEQDVAKYVGANATVGSYYQSIGEVQTRGIEAQARVNLGRGLDLIASYTFNDAEITRDITAGNIGKTPMVTPRHVASLWVDYSFDVAALEGLQVGAGLRFIGETYTTNANTATNPSATLFDAALRYDFGARNPDLKGLTAAVNVNNIENEKVATCNNGYCYLGEGRVVSGSLKYRW